MAASTCIETARKNRQAAVAALARRAGNAPRRPRPGRGEGLRMMLYRDVMVFLNACGVEPIAASQVVAWRGKGANLSAAA